MKQVEQKALFKIQIMSTDNAKSFTDRLTRAWERKFSEHNTFA